MERDPIDYYDADYVGEETHLTYLNKTPPYELADPQNGVRFSGARNAFFIPYPTDVPDYFWNNDPYDERCYRPAEKIGSYTRELSKLKKRRERAATVREEEGQIIFDFEVKKSKPAFSVKELDNQIYRLSNEYPDWSLHGHKPGMYSHYLHPYLKDKSFTDPFDWAYAHTELATGLVGVNGHLRKFPLRAIEHPFTALAGVMTNLCPDWHAERKHTKRSPELDELRARASTEVKPLRPEVLWLILENPEQFSDPGRYKKALAQVHRCIENGLLIERLDALIKRSSDPARAIELVESVYTGARPWWFKEDIDFCDLLGGDMDLDLLVKLGKTCKASFVYGVSAYKKGASGFLAVPDVPSERLWTNFAFVINYYGIGNVDRAVWIMDWLQDGLRSFKSSAEKLEFLSLFEKQALYEKPLSAIVGRMEGVDTGIPLPGISSFFTTMRGVDQLRTDKVDDTNLGVGHLMLMDQLVRRPLKVRALEVGKARFPEQRYRLLPPAEPKEQALLTSTQEEPERTNPLLGILQFYALLHETRLQYPDDVLTYYWMYFGHKLPDPYRPEPRLLRAIDRIVNLRVAGYQLPYFAAPHEREGVSERNARSKVWQLEIASALLTGHSFGRVSLDASLTALETLVTDPKEWNEPETRIDPDEGQTLRTNRFIGGSFVAANMELAARGWLPTPCMEALIEEWNTDPATVVSSTFGIPRLDAVPMLRSLFEAEVIDPGTLTRLIETPSTGYRPIDLVHGIWDAAIELMARLPDEIGRANSYLRLVLQRESRTRDRGALITQLLSEEDTRLAKLDSGEKAAHGLLDPTRLTAFVHSRIPAYVILKQLLEATGDPLDAMSEQDWYRLITRIPDPIQAEAHQPGPVQTTERVARFFLGLEVDQARLSLKDPDGDSVASLTEQVAGIIAFSLSLREKAALLTPRLSRLVRSNEQGLYTLMLETGRAVRSALCDKDQFKPRILEEIRKYREEDTHLIPVGAKIHLATAVDEEQLKLLRKILGLHQTHFRLLHAGSSLLLPAVPSGRELALMLDSIGKIGLFDPSGAELQICLPGRLPPDFVAVLGSTVIGASPVVVDYTIDSFQTNQDYATGARIMAYDAGGPRNEALPFMPGLPGRVDILGRRSLEDILTAQRVGTVLAHAVENPQGRFAQHGAWFVGEHEAVLKKHGLSWVLTAPWIFQSESEKYSNAGAQEHFAAVRALNDSYDHGLNDDMRLLVGKLNARLRPEQEKLAKAAV